MKLSIDTTDRDKIILALSEKSKEIARVEKSERQHSEKLLPEIKKFLGKHKVKLSDLKKIEVNPGPGSFSSVRTGVATANALAFALGLDQKMTKPKYNRAPNITRSKK